MKHCRMAVLLLAALLITATPALALSASGATHYGIDVSRYQGDIDFAKVKADGIEYVYIRAGEGTDYTDPYFEDNYANAKAAGLHIGFYYYVTARTVAEGRAQGERFASLVADKDYDCRLAMDFEELSGLTRSEVNNISEAFLTALMKESGEAAVIYSDWSNAQDIFGYALSDYPLWIAETGVTEPRNLDAWSEWAGWQHSSGGKVSGISGHVDLDYFTEAILLPDKSPTPTPTPEPTASPDTIVIVIEPGDFLYAISQRYGTTVETLVSLNNIVDPNLIYEGSRLIIPDVPNPNEGHTTCMVQSGETLSSIAHQYGLSIEELASLNNIEDVNLIYHGQVLRLD